MKRKIWWLALIAPALIAGCGGSLLESKKIDYKTTGKLPPLEIPPDLTRANRDERYSVPDISPKGSATYSAYAGDRSEKSRVATAATVLPSLDKMRVERAGSQRWLVVKATPDQLWPEIKEFWQELGFIVNLELPEAGVMETEWAENRAKLPQDIIRRTIGKVFDDVYSTAERDKFRTRLEKGSEPGTVEIYVSHRAMHEVFTDTAKVETRWQPQPPNPELEAEMLGRLMARLGTEPARAETAVASATAAAEKAKLVAGADGSGRLDVQESFDRAWRRVGLALDRVGFTVEDRDRTQGLYFVRYSDPEADMQKKTDEQGWLTKLAFWKSKPEPGKAPQYRIAVKPAGDGSIVTVQGNDGSPERTDTGRRILNLLLEQLK
jgi:outer membrane protein assembly factor BamC